MRWLIEKGRRSCFAGLTLFLTLAVSGSLAEDGRAQGKGVAYSVELNGEIDLTRRRELERALEHAQKKHARLVILRLDTPGGGLTTTREMISTLLAAPLPVVVYVAFWPSGWFGEPPT